MLIVRTNTMVGLIDGTVTCQNFCHDVAPSRSAAS